MWRAHPVAQQEAYSSLDYSHVSPTRPSKFIMRVQFPRETWRLFGRDIPTLSTDLLLRPRLTHRNNIALITGNAPLKWTVKLRALSLEAFRRRRSWRSLDGYRSLVRHSAPNPINNSSVLSRITSRAPIGTTSDLQQYSNTNLIFEAHPMLWGASHALSVLLALLETTYITSSRKL